MTTVGPTRRLLGILATVALALSMFAVPAHAAGPPASASIAAAARDVLAGTAGHELDFTVTNQSGAALGLLGEPINSVKIQHPLGLFTPVDATVLDASGQPAGTWTATLKPDGIILDATEGAEIAPSDSTVFRFIANVNRPNADLSREWDVGVSSNGGADYGQATPAAVGALDTLVRVLQVTATQVVSPANIAANKRATVNQGGIGVRVDVQNAGSAPLEVTPSLGGAPITVEESPAPQTIPAQSATSFLFTISFDQAGQRTLTGDASAAGADAYIATSAPITVETALGLAYVDGSLQPEFVVPGNAPDITLQVDKSGQADMLADATNTTFGLPDLGVSATLTQAVDLAAEQVYELTFADVPFPATLSDGTFDTQLTVDGVDHNGASVAITLDLDDLTLDSTVPDITSTLTTQPPAVDGAEPATTNGQQIDFGGSIEDSGQACGACAITQATIVESDTAGNTVATQDVTDSISNNGGTLSGSATLDYNAATTGITLNVTAQDPAGLANTGISDALDVDLIAPELLVARTGALGDEDLTHIEVVVSELIAAPSMQPTDWAVDGNFVTGVKRCNSNDFAGADPRSGSLATCPDDPAGFDVVVLTLNSELDREAEPVVTYQPTDVTRAFDRVQFDLADQAITAVDNLAPIPPTIATIEGLPEQDGKFYTNQSALTVEVADVRAGYTVTLYEDEDGDEVVDPTVDTELGSAVAQGDTVTIETSDLGTVERELGILARAEDANGNLGEASVGILVLDFTAPQALAYTVAGNEITVGFSETIVRGRNFGRDWIATGQAGGFPESYLIGDVSGSGDSRVLTIEDDDFDAASDSVDELRYLFDGDALDDRYEDRAGNLVSDFTLNG